jgi:hypothetical protein
MVRSLEMQKFIKCFYARQTLSEKGAYVGLPNFCVLTHRVRKMKAYRVAYLSISTFNFRSNELVLMQI